MIEAGHDPKQAVAVALANQRKHKKMADGGMVEQEEIEGQTSDPHRGMFDLQEDSHIDEGLSEVPEHHELLAHALGERENYAMGGMVGSKEKPSEVVALPESDFAEEAKKALAKRKTKTA